MAGINKGRIHDPNLLYHNFLWVIEKCFSKMVLFLSLVVDKIQRIIGGKVVNQMVEIKNIRERYKLYNLIKYNFHIPVI